MSTTEKTEKAGTGQAAESKKRVVKFTPEQLTNDCYRLFGVSSSTFAAATADVSEPLTLEEYKKHITAWQEKPVTQKKEA